MLNLLGFKKAVFAGVLDGGQNEVFLGGTRLKQFMESVDKATGSIPRPMPFQQPDGDGQEAEKAAPERRGQPRAERVEREEETEREAQRPAADAIWTDVVTAGVSLLDKLAQALSAGPRPEGGPPGDSTLRLPSGLHLPSGLIVREPSGGQPYLKLPLPKPEIVEKITGLLSALLQR
jgi:hypothetical protein